MTDDTKGSPRAVAMIWGAVLVFAASGSVVGLLAQLGAAHPIEGRNVISFCNVLFVGNLCALIALSLRFHRTLTRDNLKRLTRGDWLSMTAIALLSGALAPSLLFLAIENTTVTNVVLVGRVEPVLILVFGAVILREKPDAWIIVGTTLGLIGAGSVFVIDGIESFGKGELQAAGGAAALALSTIISKRRLNGIPMGIFSIYRTALGTLIFFVAATYLFGLSHFMDVFSPFLWQWMVVYSVVIVVGGQMLWFRGMAQAAARDISLAVSFSPLAGLVFAFLLLGEEPTRGVLIGGVIILSGIVCAQVGRAIQNRLKARRLANTADAVGHEGGALFRGV